ncbi:MAG: ABC transporter ATP-binding protein [Eubacteriales bacterium]|nr:ABC transporter ATP-binding protein [Bacillota bacterium]MBV1727125.1 ABC transporter ATP-binding protein [Desulforudis sp.]MDQ7789775.1 ABC transporter ATP-binding protein [Clostridia bacterium]MDZ4043800.1 ABC transporter ATP-binding protein [Eubacteriales bacterium]MBU4532304.1 ABC transporter ATP-binding protein [Bacillota bacterium]
MEVISARNLVKDYNGLRAVNGINFTVQRQECFGILGPNGAGKTSTVRMMFGFSPITSGELKVLGLDVSDHAREIKAQLGVVPQENNLDLDLKVLQNLLVYAGFFNIPERTARERALKLLEFFGLSDKRDAKVDHLSGGMKRRLTIARALINDPDIIILDEPTTGLDPQARHTVWQRLRQLRSRGVTLILTTHYLEEASQLCDRLIIMDHGIILDEGTPEFLVGKHVGSEVLEVGQGAGAGEMLITQFQSQIRGHLVVGDNLVLYPLNGRQLLASLQELPQQFDHYLLRPATLEDVFLKLTGRGLTV